jgi:penicillin-binding protein 2
MNIYEDLKPLQSRLKWWRILAVVLFLGLCVRFWQIQIVRAPTYMELARSNHVRQIPESAPRGLVLDRRGRILAENRPSFNLTMEKRSWSEAVLNEVVGLLPFSDQELEQMRQERETSPGTSPVLLKEDITMEEVALVESRQLELPGAMIQFVPRRYYPFGILASHALGYVGRITEEQLDQERFEGAIPNDYVGQSGVELGYNLQLMGQNGVQVVVVNSHGRRERILEERPPAWGNSLQLALDLELQQATEAAFGDSHGAAVVLDPRNGEVLALASFPSFDPNLFSGRFGAEAWQVVANDENHRLQNRALQGRYAPGSVFKLIVAAAALEEKKITPEKRLYCGGGVRLYGKWFPCHSAAGHGMVNLHEALVKSCNSYFYQVGVELQIETIARYARTFGLGSPTGVDLPFEVSGLVPDPEWKRQARQEPWYAGETVSVSVGQGSVLVTAMQMAQIAAIIGSSGDVFRPHLFLKPLPAGALADSAPTSAHGEPIRHLAFQDSTWRVLQEAMWGVVNDGGTGWRAGIPGVGVSGKTGTAQVASMQNLAETDDADRPEHLRNHAWFVGYAPRESPELAVAILVEHGGQGGQTAAPIAHAIFQTYFDRAKRQEVDDARQALLVRH